MWGTTWHGAWESDGFRRAFLRAVATCSGRAFEPAEGSDAVVVADIRDTRLDALAELVTDHLDVLAVESLITFGAPPGLPFLPPGVPESGVSE